MKDRIIVAVDGPAGSGKSSVSKNVAVKHGLKYVDSGAIYRAVTLYFIEKYGELSSETDFENEIGNLEILQKFKPDKSSLTYIASRDVSQLIRTEDIAKNIGVVSDDISVRNFVNCLLRSWSEKDSIIMDGRDIGTVVFPRADVKIYLDASVDVRSVRRNKEYREMGKNVDENSVKKQIILRDNEDMSREFGKLVKAEDAVYVDTSDMTIDEVIDEVAGIISETIESLH